VALVAPAPAVSVLAMSQLLRFISDKQSAEEPAKTIGCALRTIQENTPSHLQISNRFYASLMKNRG